MAKIYYYKNSQTGFLPLMPEDVNAAPKTHGHWSHSIGIINQSQGGIQNNINADLKTYTGPLTYYKNNLLKQYPLQKNGVYYVNNQIDNEIHIGMPDWKQGAIPFKTEDEQLEHVYKKIPLGATLYIPFIVCAGMLSGDGRKFYCTVAHNYILPEKANITLSGRYIIRQVGKYLFTSSWSEEEDPEKESWNYTGEYPVPFYNVPSNWWGEQKIINSNTEGWTAFYSYTADDVTPTVYSPYGGQIRLERISQTPQTTAFSYQSSTATAPSNVAGVGWISGSVSLFDLKLTFNEPTS